MEKHRLNITTMEYSKDYFNSENGIRYIEHNKTSLRGFQQGDLVIVKDDDENETQKLAVVLYVFNDHDIRVDLNGNITDEDVVRYATLDDIRGNQKFSILFDKHKIINNYVLLQEKGRVRSYYIFSVLKNESNRYAMIDNDQKISVRKAKNMTSNLIIDEIFGKLNIHINSYDNVLHIESTSLAYIK